MESNPSAGLLANILLVLVSLAVLFILSRKNGLALAAFTAYSVRAVRGLQVQIEGDISDGLWYDRFAVDLVRYWRDQGADPGTWLGKDGFPALLATIYSTIGYSPSTGYLINALAGGLAVLVVGATTAQMGWFDAIKPSAWLVAVWPVGIVWGGMLLREAIVGLLLAVGVWGSVRLYKLQIASGAAAILGAGVAMIFMRGGLSFLILIGMPLTAALVTNLKHKTSPSRWIVALMASGIAILALSWLSDYFAGGQYFQYRVEVSAEQNAGTSSFAQAGLGAGAVDQSLLGHALRVPITALGPFPWQVTNLSLAIAAFDAALWIAVWGLAIYATRTLRPRAEGLLFMIPAFALIVALAANSANFGLIIRLRGQGIVLMAPLAALGFVLWRRQRAANKEVARQEILEAASERALIRARSTRR